MIDPFAVILPSAGLGTRFGKEIPKQYQTIQGKLVINYSLELFLTFKECKKIIEMLHFWGHFQAIIKFQTPGI